MESNSRRTIVICIVLFMVLSVPFIGETQENQELSFSKLSGLPEVNTPEELLPGGAIAYLRANNIQTLMVNLDSLITSFVPEKVLPPELQPFLSNPQPVIAFLTSQAFGQPIEVSQLSSMFGIALDRPVSVALYPMPPEKGLVISLPISNPEVLANTLQNILTPETVEQGSIGNVTYYRVTTWNLEPLREIYLMATNTTAFLCASLETAQMLVNSANMGVMASEPIISKSIAKYADRDLTLVVSPGMLKAQLPFFKQQLEMAIVPAFGALRERIAEIPPTERLMIDARLRVQFGIDGLAQLVNFVEAYSTGISKVLLDKGFQFLTNLNGLALAMNIEETLQTLALTLYSLDVQPQQFPTVLPLPEIKQAINKLPGKKTTIMAVGQTPEAQSSPLFTAILNAIEQELQNKGLPMEGFLAYKSYYLAKQPCASLESRVPWTLRTIVATAEKMDFSQFATFWELLKATMDRLAAGPLFLPVTLMPAMTDDVIAQYFTEKAEIINQNAQRYQEMRQQLPFQQPFFTASGRFFQDDAGENLKELVFENIYTTRRGYFGYQQHELVNRKILFQKTLPEYEVLYEANADMTYLETLFNAEEIPVPAAVETLLDQVPADASALSLFRTLYFVEDLLRVMTEVEILLHRELDDFLIEVQKIVDASGGDELETKLIEAGLDVPLFLAAIHLDESGKVYGMLPGGLHYPRPQAMPVIASWFTDFLAKTSEIGGSVSFMASQPEELELSSVQSTEALALLVKTVVNNFYSMYMTSPEGMELLMTQFAHPEDLQNLSEEEIFVNPIWKGLQDAGLPFLKTQVSRQNQTKVDMRAIGTALGSYLVDFDFFPMHSELTSLWNVELPYEYYGGAYTDGWDMPFNYVSNISGSQYLLISYGKDNAPGSSTGSEFDEDIIYMDGTFVSPKVDVDTLNRTLISAVHENAIGMVEALLQIGVDPNAKDEAGQSALAIATDLGFNEIVEILNNAGAAQ
ncbi:type II secretion system protein G [Candidatus Vecturithrix granuli]|uniref:Type II secretion system protein G n=1 Tax=Vecturithrix granuli TaxID=1499967 RepID=A0A081C793_VECG1|nr:type II secretion system protein G [Candidatus Vecturithrix granuli]